MKINEEKYISIIMYILSKCHNKPNLGKTVLCTVMYFIDFDYYERYGKFLTKETYIKSKRGIKPKHFKKITEDLIAKKQLFLRKEPYYNRILHRYYPTVIPTLNFTSKELIVINSCIRQLSDSNANTITRYAYRDEPLTKTKLGDEINYEDVFLR
ncbi:type II toxin-antitoxin system antitoxin SocA domain-containing protein [uncultured Methanobrevibacter sp.]|uniref:type II toxin-antitoxin system antitoxin SocA domain-containing protein n=1 Tax=uncultured Methanobrevibacter sp. TaxID=253161 RepID=UPI00261CC4A8|nr:type II toxin-antitoxin system antitoxin SocA domain-containing protein [uncultured Methanobrevibacter sp.]